MRKTYHYDPLTESMVDGPAPRKTDSSYHSFDHIYSDSPFIASDGTVINSRKKHRDYMKRHDLTTMDDFKETWDKAAKEREKFAREGTDRKERRRQVEEAIHKLETRKE